MRSSFGRQQIGSQTDFPAPDRPQAIAATFHNCSRWRAPSNSLQVQCHPYQSDFDCLSRCSNAVGELDVSTPQARHAVREVARVELVFHWCRLSQRLQPQTLSVISVKAPAP